MNPAITKLDLIMSLWQDHGIYALGWIFCIPLAVYIALLHKRNNTIYKEYIEAIKAANAAVVPLLEKAVAVMTQVITVVDTAADGAHNRDVAISELVGKMNTLAGQLDIVIKTFIGERAYAEDAIAEGSERARAIASSVGTSGAGKRQRKPRRRSTSAE